jgi:hypothetical protein
MDMTTLVTIDRATYETALADARALSAAGQLDAARERLLEAHDTAWSSARLHVLSHLRLLRHHVLRERRLRGLRFQLLQLCVAAPNSWTGSGPPVRR